MRTSSNGSPNLDYILIDKLLDSLTIFVRQIQLSSIMFNKYIEIDMYRNQRIEAPTAYLSIAIDAPLLSQKTYLCYGFVVGAEGCRHF